VLFVDTQLQVHTGQTIAAVATTEEARPAAGAALLPISPGLRVFLDVTALLAEDVAVSQLGGLVAHG
jgi:hypothetical protein